MRVAVLALIGWVLATVAAQAEPIRIVAAENFYGDLATQIGGADVAISSILSNPDQDPHLFEASPSTAREIAAARIVIYNGADYDPWAAKLLAAGQAPGREAIEVAALVHKKPGDNPHLWYEPSTMPSLARVLAAKLEKIDPAHKEGYAARLATFEKSLAPLSAKIAALRAAHAGTPVTATEPVFGYMAAALGLEMRNDGFQLAVMNDTEPSARQIAAFESDLRKRTVKVLFYNSQTSEPLTERVRKIAQDSGVPIVGVTETEPKGKTYQEWMLSQLNALEQALAAK